MSIFTGAGVALVTPFKEDLSVDYDQLEKFIDFQIDNGTDSIVICGTSGEASTMSHDEQIEVVSACVSHVNGRVPVIAGAGANCTDEALNLAKRSEKAGADGLLVVTPYYNKATQKGLEEYYTTVGNSVDIPIIMYNVPGRTGTNIQPATAVKIAKSVDNIVAIKEASGDIGQVATLAALADGCLDIYSGNDDQVVPLLALGGKGVISVLSNVAQRETHDMLMKFLEGDVKGSLDIQLKFHRHQSMLVRTRVASNKSPWLSRCDINDEHLIAISHGEGRFVCNETLLNQLIDNGQIATQYVDLTCRPTMDMRYNPNGSVLAIEGITSPDGRVSFFTPGSSRTRRRILR